MSYNGSGTFNINTAGQPVVTGTVISSTAFNALTADLGTGLSTAITKDGQTVATARIPFAQGINSSLVTDATNTTTGSIITAGGVGIAKALFVGTTANIAGTTTLAGVTATSITDSGLTSGRVTYAGTAGLLQDSANLTFNGTTLTANTIGAFTLGGTVAGGGNNINNVIIGATTPLAGAFTTLTASTSAIIGSGNAAAKIIADGANNFQIINNALTPNSGNFALEQNLNGTTFLNSASGQTLNLGVNSSVIAAITSTGLALTGALSVSGNTNGTFDTTITNASTGTAAQSRFVAVGGSTTIIGSFSSGYTTSGQFQANRGYIYNTGSAGILYGVASGSHIWSIDSGATANMILDSSGNLGIGTTAPAANLNIFAANTVTNSNGNLYVQTSTTAGTDVGGQISLGGYHNGTSSSTPFASIAGRKENATAGNQAGYLAFSTDTSGGTNTERMRIDSSGNLGLGVTPSAASVKTFEIGTIGNGIESRAAAITGLTQNTYFNTNFKYAVTGRPSSAFELDTGAFYWYTAASGTAGNAITFTQAMTLDASGNLLVGVTSFASSNTNSLMFQVAAGGGYFQHASGTGGGATYCQFNYNASNIGSITQNGTTGVLYNLTSDYRLKNDQQPLTGAKDFIMALKPKKWQWWDGSGEGVGFVAHEFMEVAKYSGHGEKDAVEMQTYEISPAVPATFDEEGNELTAAVEAVMGEREVPKYQSIQPSSSEVMANLISFIQEQQAIITALTTRITALENK